MKLTPKSGERGFQLQAESDVLLLKCSRDAVKIFLHGYCNNSAPTIATVAAR
jgi:hypothetical protein